MTKPLPPKKVPNPVDVRLGARIKEARKEQGLSLDDLGFRVGVSFFQIYKYELAQDRVAVSRLCDLAVALGKPMSWFLEEIESGIKDQQTAFTGKVSTTPTVKRPYRS